jgi:ferredoxin
MVDDELFSLDADGYVVLGDGVDVPAGKEHAAELGVAACPVQALRAE